MRALIVTAFLFATEAVAGEHSFVSPSGEFEAYTIPATEDGSGMKLFLHRVKSRDAGELLKQNNRWIDAKWSPDSHFLALIDHVDGHMSDVYIFAVAAADPLATLVYHTPSLHEYDVKWDVNGWNEERPAVILDKEVKTTEGKITHQKVVATIRTEPLRLDPIK